MPRAPRVFIDGGFYQVCNRISRGDRVSADPDDAARFLRTIAEVKHRDGFAVIALRMIR